MPAVQDYSKSSPFNAREGEYIASTYGRVSGCFNLKQSNTRKIRAAIAKSLSNTGRAKFALVGDSTTAAFTALAATQAPAIIIRNLLEKRGHLVGTGPVLGNPGGAGGPSGFQDSRWVFSGAGSVWVSQAGNSNGITQTTTLNSTATFTSDKTGTIVEFTYLNLSGAFSYSIDGGAAVPITPTGAANLATISVTGLANTTHTLLITSTTATTFYLGWAEVRPANSISIGNFGVSGSNTGHWVDSNFYFPGKQVANWAPDGTFIDLGINDVGANVPVETIKTNLQALITQAKTTGDAVLITSNPHQSADYTAINQAKYALATANDIPLIDIFDRFTSYAVANPLGYYNDAAHPSAIGYADKGVAIYGFFKEL